MSHSPGFYCPPPPGSRWPRLAARPVRIGGVTVTCAQAEGALAVLERAGGVMVRQVLAAASSPLAGCDYHAALAPFRRLPAEPASGRGAAGRPAARQAFMRAIRAALDQAERAEPGLAFAAELGTARDAFGSDAEYAAAMARAAVAVLQREHAARLRELLAAGVRQAVTACSGSPESGGRRGEFACTASSACGTGDCRLASGPLAGVTVPAMAVPAGPGRVPRPANHSAAGQGFGTAAALAALEACALLDVQQAAGTVRVAGSDRASARDSVPSGTVLASTVRRGTA